MENAMAKGNTWCKRLMIKAKQQEVKRRYGTMTPLFGRTSPEIRPVITRKGNTTIYHIPTRDLPSEEPKPNKPIERKFLAPVRADWKPKGFGKGQRSGCVYKG